MRTDLWGSPRGHFDCLLSFIEARISKLCMWQRLRVDGDLLENAPRVEADIFYTDKKRCIFKNIRIRVDGAPVCCFCPRHSQSLHKNSIHIVLSLVNVMSKFSLSAFLKMSEPCVNAALFAT